MDFFEAVDRRHSYKQPFADNPVPLEHLVKIADAGLKAPTGRNLQCVNLVILDNRQSLAPLAELAVGRYLSTAPAAIAVFTDSARMTETMNFEEEDYAAAAMSMQLAATALGYVTLWLDSPYKKPDSQAAACRALKVPDSYTLRVVLPIGLPAEACALRDKMGFWERVSLNVYGNTEA